VITAALIAIAVILVVILAMALYGWCRHLRKDKD